ncbi:MAG TPA: hypothetical protein VM536_11420 [Chloroflexia bacterium]|nr:hypothetical protein [Chloroflexia bacterium]
MRRAVFIGALAGVVAAVLMFVLQDSTLALVLELLLALAAGVGAAVLGIASAGAVPGVRGLAARLGAVAGATAGVLGGLAFTLVAYQVLSTTGGREQLNEALRQQGGGAVSADSVIGIASFCVGCVFVIMVPTLTAGVGALGGWLYSLTRPKAAPPPPPAYVPPPGASL